SGKKRLQLQGFHSDPFVIDWDGDGDLDLISGSYQGGVQWAENLAGKGKLPELREFQWLIKPARHTDDNESDADEDEAESDELVTEESVTGPARSTRVWVADVNGDGKLDLLVGDTVSLAAPAEGLSVETMKKKHAEWKAKVARTREIFDSPTASDRIRERALERMEELHEQLSEIVAQESTGFVWLYLQK
ncbi:MAG TPA: VCBS repeat-containing protein, partial [Planctomycetaceae bacterium]|nr:VCBS repeat-containing protein [Planctomycetaceae bacterium]